MSSSRNRRRGNKNTNDNESKSTNNESVGANNRTSSAQSPVENNPRSNPSKAKDSNATGKTLKILNPQGKDSAKAIGNEVRIVLAENTYNESSLPGSDPPGSAYKIESINSLGPLISIFDLMSRNVRTYSSTPDRSGLVIIDVHIYRLMSIFPLLYKCLNSAHDLLLSEEYYSARFQASLRVFEKELGGTARGVQIATFFGDFVYPGEGLTQTFNRFRAFGLGNAILFHFAAYIRDHSDEDDPDNFVKVFLDGHNRFSYWFKRAADETYRDFFDRRSFNRMFNFIRRYGTFQPAINNQRRIGEQTHFGPVFLNDEVHIPFIVASCAAFLLARLGISSLVNGSVYGEGLRYMLVHEVTRAPIDLMYLQLNPATGRVPGSICVISKITGMVHLQRAQTMATPLAHPWTKYTANFVHACTIYDLLTVCCHANSGDISVHAFIAFQYPDEDNVAAANQWDRCLNHNRTPRSNAFLAIQEVLGCGPFDVHYLMHFNGVDDMFYCDANGYFQNSDDDYPMVPGDKVVYDRIFGQFVLNCIKCFIPFVKNHIAKGFEDVGERLEKIPTGTSGCDSQALQIVPSAYAAVSDPDDPIGYDNLKSSFDCYLKNSPIVSLPSRFGTALGLVLIPHVNFRRIFGTVVRTSRPLEDMRLYISQNPASKDPSKRIRVRRDAI